jgi:hypothetical protein
VATAGGYATGMTERDPHRPEREDEDDVVPTIASDEPPDDTSGGPLSGGAGEGSAHGPEDAPDVDVPGGADEGV